MDQLIPLQQADGGETMINLRDLHSFLEVKTEFRHWIKRRIEKYSFVEGTDYTRSKMTALNDYEYFGTISMAKQLTMVENNEKGKKAREYFIAVENEYRQEKLNAPKKNAAQLFMESAQLFNQHENRISALESKLALQAQLAEEAKVAALALPGPGVELKAASARQLLNERINYYVASKNRQITHQEAWRILYAKAVYRLGIHFNLLGNKLDQVEKKGKLDLLYALACEIFPIDDSQYKEIANG